MCGIAGFIDYSRSTGGDELHRKVAAMANALSHRGPDDKGTWCDVEAGLALAHRRLSILDLSSTGHQPMISESGQYAIVFNGEIYNFRELRRQLEAAGERFRGTSDTEVLLSALMRWGVRSALERLNGMFAFAFYSCGDRTLWLARDRMGEKPLYYGRQGSAFLFASEIKALRNHGEFQDIVDRNSITLLLRHGYIPAPYTVYSQVQKLPPASFLCVNLDTGEQGAPERYWSAEEVAEHASRNPSRMSERAAVEQLDRLLRDAIRVRMVSDVPLGAFLSGGIDSSLVVALMQAQSASRVKTFTIGFSEAQYDEAIHAAKVAQHLGADHTELYLTPSDALNLIPRLPAIYDEPFADSSQIPTFLVSQLARQAVTVCLSGDGGDELFGGYERYAKCEQIWSRIDFVPLTTRRFLAAGMRAVSPAVLDRIIGWALPKINRWGRRRTFGEAIYKAAEILAEPEPASLYHQLVSHWKRPAEVVLGATEPATTFRKSTGKFELAEWMMYMDTVTYLPDDILVKLDRATMAVGLESRVPLLDPQLMQFAWQLPMRMKRRDSANKWILKEVLRQYIPDDLVNRPKMGFGIPLGQWLRGPLREWAEGLLDERRLRTESIFHPAPIRKKWEEHLAGAANWQYHLWDVLMFQAWLETTKKGSQVRRDSTELAEVL